MAESQTKGAKNGNITIKTACLVMVMNIILTCFKFLIYFFSGSLAVLAEAWHSFTDIATSGMVFFAIWFTNRKLNKIGEEQPPQSINKPEMAVSLCIGILLFFIACLLFKKLLSSEVPVVRNPMMSGIMFLIFAIGSYFISYFETRIGKKEGSLGLVSDGMHARADMIASLLTGFSLIVYSIGLNIDKWIAGTIAFFILALSIETIANVYLVYRNGNTESLYKYRFFNTILLIFNKNTLKRIPEALSSLFIQIFGDNQKSRFFYRLILSTLAIIIILIYISTTCYTVSIHETAIVERFGRPVNTNSPIPPGIHTKLPWPFDKVIKVATTTIHELNIGNISKKDSRAFIWTLNHGTEEAFLTGDNNFFYPYIILHYRIINTFDYLYKNTDPEKLLNEIGHKIATSLFAKESFYDIATTGRKKLEDKMLLSIQRNLDGLQSGIGLINVNFKDIHPPMSISKSFENVIAGYQEKQELINNAIGYANNILPESRGKAAMNIQSSQSYIINRICEAEGKAKRFELTLPETAVEKQVSISRIYRETMQDALKDKTTIIIDPKAGTPDIWTNFDSLSFSP